ncbi:hypothetical protein MMC18_008472 [Xylographa bjoerkii]|nr:hypothetical protein [Xylographa bjoerkii]
MAENVIYPPVANLRSEVLGMDNKDLEDIKAFVDNALATRLDILHDSLINQFGNIGELLRNLRVEDYERNAPGEQPKWAVLRRLQIPATSARQANMEQEILERKFNELQVRTTELDAEKESTHQENRRYQKQVQDLQTRVRELEINKRKVQEQNVKLREIIIKGGGSDNEPLDSDIITKFSELRGQIQKIVHKYYHQSCLMRPLPIVKAQDRLFDRQKAFYRGTEYNSLTEDIRRLRVRGKMFQLLYENLFDDPCFGLNEKYEDRFADFELLLRKCENRSQAEIVEWRRRTVECASWLAQQSQRPERAAIYIEDFMQPLVSPQPKTATESPYQRDLLTLCTDASKLALRWRGCKADYRVEFYKDGTPVDSASEGGISEQAFNGPFLDRRQRFIDFTISGSLVKEDSASGERYILERSHVVCRA